MKKFEAYALCKAIREALLGSAELSHIDEHPQLVQIIIPLRSDVERLLRCCRDADLPVSAAAVERSLMLFQLSTGALGDSLESSITRAIVVMEDEIKAKTYFYIKPRQAELYSEPLKHWETVVRRFPKSRQNIEECSRCMAFERYGAAVFHVLLVAEYGVIQVANLMDVAGDKPGWGSLQKIERLIKLPYHQRDPLTQQHSKLLESVVPLATVVKDSWRHKLSHVDNQIVWQDTDFSPQVADEIIAATRGFMRKLATDLPEVP